MKLKSFQDKKFQFQDLHEIFFNDDFLTWNLSKKNLLFKK